MLTDKKSLDLRTHLKYTIEKTMRSCKRLFRDLLHFYFKDYIEY